MPLYTLYPCRADGACDTFLTFVLHDDAAARTRSDQVLREHRSADHIDIWCGVRRVPSKAPLASEAVSLDLVQAASPRAAAVL